MGVCSYQSNVATRSEVQSRNGNALSIPLDARCGFGPARPTLLNRADGETYSTSLLDQ